MEKDSRIVLVTFEELDCLIYVGGPCGSPLENVIFVFVKCKNGGIIVVVFVKCKNC